jgi:hypothetical protein
LHCCTRHFSSFRSVLHSLTFCATQRSATLRCCDSV